MTLIPWNHIIALIGDIGESTSGISSHGSILLADTAPPCPSIPPSPLNIALEKLKRRRRIGSLFIKFME